MKRFVNLLLDSFTLFHIHQAASYGFHCYVPAWLILYSPPAETVIQRQTGQHILVIMKELRWNVEEFENKK